VVPGAVSIGDTRLPAFLRDQQILVWDAAIQKRAFANLFGSGVEIFMRDIAPEIGKEIPSTSGKSLLRIRELSRMAKYSDKETGELDVFVNLFVTFVKQREKLFDDSQDLQLACLGTVADIMPLLDENRIIVKQGLRYLMEKPRPGLSDLLFKLELSGRRIETSDISWLLCPAINSTGRMGNPRKALDLLLENDPKKRDSLADEILGMNEERKKIGEEIWTMVEPVAEENMKRFGDKLAVVYSAAIPRGITGIMASRLTCRFRIPALVATIGEKVITASLRSVRNYDLRNLLEPLEDLFIDWGGHDFAAGFSVAPENWERFLERLKPVTAEIILAAEEDGDTLMIDAELPLSYLNPDILNLIDLFEPYGQENEPLNFLARKLRISDISLMGKPEAKHVKLSLDTGKHKWPAVYWQAAEKGKRDFDLGDEADLVFNIGRNWYKGNETPQLTISDLKRRV
jgi:single-stranded-DNA-specific exonuclease